MLYYKVYRIYRQFSFNAMWHKNTSSELERKVMSAPWPVSSNGVP